MKIKWHQDQVDRGIVLYGYTLDLLQFRNTDILIFFVTI